MHPRQAIRDAVHAQILNKTAAADRVFKTRFIGFRPRELPSAAVYTLAETVVEGSQNTAPRRLERNLTVAIECLCEVADSLPPVDDQLDDIALQVEKAIHADDSLGDIRFGETGVDIWLLSTEIDVIPDGERTYGVVRLSYNVEYYTFAPDADDVEMDDFTRAEIEYNIADEQDTADAAHDSLTEGLEGN